MSLIHSSWLSSVLHDSPMTLTWRASHSGASLATAPSSVVHTGAAYMWTSWPSLVASQDILKSSGCEKRIAQDPAFQEWKPIGPWVVSASKSGAVSPRRRLILEVIAIICRWAQQVDRKTVGQDGRFKLSERWNVCTKMTSYNGMHHQTENRIQILRKQEGH